MNLGFNYLLLLWYAVSSPIFFFFSLLERDAPLTHHTHVPHGGSAGGGSASEPPAQPSPSFAISGTPVNKMGAGVGRNKQTSGIFSSCFLQKPMQFRFFPFLFDGSLRVRINIYKILIWCQGFGQEFFFISAEVCDSRNWNFRSNIASFERRLRGTAPTPLALPCPFRTST